MNTIKTIGLAGALCMSMIVPQTSSAQIFHDNTYGNTDMSKGKRLYLGFSVGDGAYINYRCSSGYSCNSVVVAPFDFEVLVGYRIAKRLYLDLAVNWAVDYYDGVYDEITYVAGLRPGLRFVFPLLFHRHVYIRGAVPVQYTIDEEKNLVFGVLLGIGMEWRFENIGLFGEVNISPYFVEIYPGYLVIPAQARVGVALHL